MAERYKRVFLDQECLYHEGSPVTIEARALLTDNKTGKVLAQIKFKNISQYIITAVFVKLDLFDVAGKFLQSIEFQYLDLNVRRDADFGQNTPIAMPVDTVRSVKVNVVKVINKYGICWENSDECWISSFKKNDIGDYFSDEESQMYQEMLDHKTGRFYPEENKEHWLCTCGSVNENSENTCHICHNSREKVFQYLDKSLLIKDFKYKRAEQLLKTQNKADVQEALAIFEELGAWKDSQAMAAKCKEYLPVLEDRERKEQELLQKQQEEDEKRQAEEKAVKEAGAKKKKKIGIVVAIIVFIVIAIYVAVQMKNRSAYADAVALFTKGQYEDAEKEFKNLGNYKYSSENSKLCSDAITYTSSDNYITTYEEFINASDVDIREQMLSVLYQDHPILNCVEGNTVKFGKLSNYGSIHNIDWGSSVDDDIEWTVLSRESDDDGFSLVLCTKNVLLTATYNTAYENITDGSYNDFFSSEEKSVVAEAPSMLSKHDIDKYMSTSSLRQTTDLFGVLGPWWVYTPNDDEGVMVVLDDGSYFENADPSSQKLGVRLEVTLEFNSDESI